MQSFWRPGVNPSVDVALFYQENILLIRRGQEPYKNHWALPGGFWETDALREEPWRPGAESARAAARRELLEETGIIVQSLRPGGIFEERGRDPRDTEERWSQSHLFIGILDDYQEPRAGDDACDTCWVSLQRALEIPIAFDHAQMIKKAAGDLFGS